MIANKDTDYRFCRWCGAGTPKSDSRKCWMCDQFPFFARWHRKISRLRENGWRWHW